MLPSRLHLPILSGCLLLLMAAANSASACSIPVYRYALEKWPSDPYRVVLFHRGPMTEQQKQLAADLGPDGKAGEKYANLNLRTVDLDGEVDDEMLALWKSQSQKDAEQPWMVVRYPDTANYGPAWSGPLTKSAVETLIDSPVRREIAKRLLAGETAVWILLESGDQAKDDAAYATLKQQLEFEAKNLKLPEVDEADLKEGSDAKEEAAKLTIGFSIIRLSRDNPAEKMTVEMLLGSEGSGENSLRDPEFVNQTMAFPIFGRARIRYGLVGAGIVEDTIHEACAYLTGPCKCQIKTGVENRGMDLLTAVDWERLVASTIRDEPLPPLLGLGQFDPEGAADTSADPPGDAVASITPKLSAPGNESGSTTNESGSATGRRDKVFGESGSGVESGSGDSTRSESSSSLSRNLYLILGLGAFVVVAASFLMISRKN